MFFPQAPITTSPMQVSYPYSSYTNHAEYSIHFSRADIFGQRKTSVNYEEENNDDGDDDDDGDGDGDGDGDSDDDDDGGDDDDYDNNDDNDKMGWNRLYLGLECIGMRWNKIK